MDDNTSTQVVEVPVNGRGCRAFIEGKTLHLQFDLTSAPQVSKSQKTEVIATASLRGLIVPGIGKPVGGSFSVYTPK